MWPSIVMLQQNTCTQKSKSFGLDFRKQAILRRSAYAALVTVFPLGM